MYINKKILAIIPARGGSKGIPKKNVKYLAGKPLIAYPIECALKTGYIDKIVVSTDDEEISKISKRYGAEVIKRPKKLATDTSLVIESIRYTVEELEKNNFNPDLIILLEPTAPLRTTDDIDNCIKLLIEENADSVATFSKSCIPPNRLWRIEYNNVRPYIKGANAFLPRQKQPIAFQLNGLVYMLTKEILFKNPKKTSLLLGKAIPLITPKDRSLDIDDEVDFMIAEKLIQTNKGDIE